MTLTRTQKRQLETRERIFRVAMELFAQKGFDQTTVSEITEAADIGKGTFFTYFPNKEAIFRRPGEISMELMSQSARDDITAGKSMAITLTNILCASASWHEENKSITRQMSRSSISFSLGEKSSKGKLMGLLEEIIKIGQQKGEFKTNHDAHDTALVLTGVYFTVIAFWAFQEVRLLENLMRSSVNIVIEGLQV